MQKTKRLLTVVFIVLGLASIFSACDSKEQPVENNRYKKFTVVSHSMEPDYFVGSEVYYEPIEDFSTIKAGDDIVFKISAKDAVLHRVHSVIYNEENDKYSFHTYAIANSYLDHGPVSQDLVLGKVVKLIK